MSDPQSSALSFSDEHYELFFELATQGGNLDDLRACLARIHPNHAGYGLDAPRATALHIAARSGRPELVEMVLPLTDPSAQDINGETALHAAANQGSAQCARLLATACGVNAKDNNGSTALVVALSEGHEECARFLASVSDLDTQDKHGFTALMVAAADNKLANCIDFLAPGSTLSFETEDGLTALLFAAHGIQEDCVRALIPHCKPADFRAQMKREHYTALMCAVEWNRPELVELLAPRSDLSQKSEGGLTPLEMAVNRVVAFSRPEHWETLDALAPFLSEEEFHGVYLRQIDLAQHRARAPRAAARLEAHELSHAIQVSEDSAMGATLARRAPRSL